MELKLTLTLKSCPKAARSHLFPLQVNSYPAPHLVVIVVKGRLGHSLSVIKDTLVACGGWNTLTRKSCISWKKGHDGWEDFHTLRSNCVFSLQIHQTIMPSRRYCEVENNYITSSQLKKHISFQPIEVLSRSGGHGRQGGHNHLW